MWLELVLYGSWPTTSSHTYSGGHRDSARLRGESCWPKESGTIWGQYFARKTRNSWRLSGEGVGAHRQLTRGPYVPSPGTKYKHSKKCFFCHIYCAHLGTPWYSTVTVSRAVANRESRYPLTVGVLSELWRYLSREGTIIPYAYRMVEYTIRYGWLLGFSWYHGVRYHKVQ